MKILTILPVEDEGNLQIIIELDILNKEKEDVEVLLCKRNEVITQIRRVLLDEAGIAE